MAAGLTPVGWLAAETSPWYAAIAVVGFSSGFFLVPLTAHLQDKIAPDQRGRVLSAQNLLVSISGIAAILASTLMKWSESPSARRRSSSCRSSLSSALSCIAC